MNPELFAALCSAAGLAGLFALSVIALCRRAKLPGFERRRFGVRLRQFR